MIRRPIYSRPVAVGGDGDDTLWGDDGADDLTGGANDDPLWGGPGGDGIDWMAVLIEAGASASGVMLQAAYPAMSTGVSLVD